MDLRANAVTLKPELFEGCRFDFTRPLNQKFSLQHSLFMGSVEVPSQGSQTFKVPAASYEFGANLIDQKVRNCFIAVIVLFALETQAARAMQGLFSS